MSRGLAERLGAAGFRLTGPRRAILDLLEERDGEHLSAADIHRAIRERGVDLDLVSVYRTLNLLVGMGLVHEAGLSESHAHFEIEHGGEVHLSCPACSTVIEARLPVAGHAMRQVARIARRHGFRMAGVGVEVRGLCAPCRARERRERRSASAGHPA